MAPGSAVRIRAGLARLLVCACCLPLAPAPPVTGRSDPALAVLDETMAAFLERNKVPGASVAVVRQGRLVYARGFGWADAAGQRPVEPGSLFRIASLSKPLTAATVLKLAESGALRVQDPAFPPLGIRPFLPPGAAADPRMARITIWQLLHHSGGFDREQSFDPALYSHEIARSLGTPLPVSPVQIIQYMTGRSLEFEPGTRTSYSNFGYLALGRVIEQASGKPYEACVKEAVLAPLGITDMRLGRTLPEGRVPGEVTYRSARNPKPGPSAFGDGLRPYPYGVWCLESLDACAGWLASSIDLVRFASALGREGLVLDQPSLERMFARPELTGYDPDGAPKELYLACGWYVRKGADGRRVAYHRGLLDGTSTLLVHDGNGTDWAVLFNSDADPKGRELAVLIDPLLTGALEAIKAWPEVDLFGQYLGQRSSGTGPEP